MRFNAGHGSIINVQPVAALPGIRELHIGHAIVADRSLAWRSRAADES
jgi:pyridoxine 5-phosphate synthase